MFHSLVTLDVEGIVEYHLYVDGSGLTDDAPFASWGLAVFAEYHDGRQSLVGYQAGPISTDSSSE
eukprot:2537131-Karenia_brevis.AAC.1